jgi:hypothetical protein
MKKRVLAIDLAVATALALSQSAAVAKSSRGHTGRDLYLYDHYIIGPVVTLHSAWPRASSL